VRILREIGDRAKEAALLDNIAAVSLNLGRRQEAIASKEQAIAVLEKMGLSHDAGGTSLTQMRQELVQIQSGAGPPAPSGGPPPTSDLAAEVLQAVRAFLDADDWEATRRVVETQGALLFRPEVEALFEQNIAQARAANEQRAVQMLQLHLALWRDCQAHGVEAAFAKLASAASAELPFDAQLIPRTVAALLGSPQDRMALAQHLSRQAAADEELQALLTTIQTALFGGELSQLGQDLRGVYRQAWEAIVQRVATGGVDPELFTALVQNTRAVLGPAAHQRDRWRENLVQVRQQAAAQDDRPMIALLDAVIALLDAGGDPSGLNPNLTGIHAQTWHTILDQL
jgi:hypothetical protein